MDDYNSYKILYSLTPSLYDNDTIGDLFISLYTIKTFLLKDLLQAYKIGYKKINFSYHVRNYKKIEVGSWPKLGCVT